MLTTFLNYLADNKLETLAFMLSLLGVWLTIKEKVINWPIGIVACILYIYIFYQSGLYGDEGLQVFYVIAGFYGWYEWLYKGGEKKEFVVSRVPKRVLIVLLLLTPPFGLVLGKLLSHYTKSNVPYSDAILTSLSLAATWLAAKKFLENWLLWVLTDFLYVILYIVKDLYLTSVLYLLFAILAIYGHFAWKKQLLLQGSSA